MTDFSVLFLRFFKKMEIGLVKIAKKAIDYLGKLEIFFFGVEKNRAEGRQGKVFAL